MKDTREIAKDYTNWMVKTGGFARDMTMRDYFAAKAMQAMLSNPRCTLDPLSQMPSAAFEMADAMLKERAK